MKGAKHSASHSIDRANEKLLKAAKLESKIKGRKNLLANALRIPPALQQFKKTLDPETEEKIYNQLIKYRPENRREKIERLKKENPKEGAKPILLKFGLNHIISLIEKKKAKFVAIAADVHPIENVIFLPTLCKKMDVPYCLFNEKAKLGSLVNMKNTACVALCDGVTSEMMNIGKDYLENYENTMTIWGGGVLLSKTKDEKMEEEIQA